MHQYFFILGREPELALAEIRQVTKDIGFSFSIEKLTEGYLVISSEQPLPDNLQMVLAGTIKIGEIKGVVDNNQTAVEKFIKTIFTKGGRIIFGFSWYDTKPDWLDKLGLVLKRELAGEYKVRFVVSREKVLSSVTVQKNHLLPPDGYELVFLTDGQKVLVGRTLSVQPFADYVARDFSRPGREARVGMLPPKLAHLLVNVAGGVTLPNILDPFCGAGTILQEAAILGIPQIFGSDISPESVKRSQDNWRWLKTKHPEIKSDGKIILSDVINLSNQLSGQLFSAIVCEPFLGPPQRGGETISQFQQIIKDLSHSYNQWLLALAKLLQPTGTIVMIWPIFKYQGQYLFLPLLSGVAEAGLKIVGPLTDAGLVWLTDRQTMIYERPDQKVAREVVILKKN